MKTETINEFSDFIQDYLDANLTSDFVSGKYDIENIGNLNKHDAIRAWVKNNPYNVFISVDEFLPPVQSIETERNKTYLVIRKTYGACMAMLIADNKFGGCSWYSDYSNEIRDEVLYWMDIK